MKIMHLVVLIWTLDRHHAYPVAEFLHVTIQTCKSQVDYLNGQIVYISHTLRDNMSKEDPRGWIVLPKKVRERLVSLPAQMST